MATSTVENYIKQILIEEQKAAGEPVGMGTLATALAVSPGTATTMIKSLSKAHLVEYEARVGVHLTESGRALAMDVLRRHRVIELFLVNILGMKWWDVHGEAERLEHAVSQEVLNRMEALLGYPTLDPHGDPIPGAEGQLETRALVGLDQCEPGTRARIGRILDQAPTFLKFLEEKKLQPGAEVELVERDLVAKTLVLARVSGGQVVLSLPVAEKILLEKKGKW
jgi:DtxR family transcriptional regulator, Mn-dependent transcriptional regulator